MSKLAEVAERLAETRRWLDQEASKLAARLDQLEKRAPIAIQTAHRLLDEQLKGLEETERMVQQWMSATADLAEASKSKPQPAPAVATPVAPLPKPPEMSKESLMEPFDPAEPLFEEQHQYVDKLERALQKIANEPPDPNADSATRLKAPAETAPAPDSRRPPDEQLSTLHLREEGGWLERALQTLANMPRPRGALGGNGTPSETDLLAQKAEEIIKRQKAESAAMLQKAEVSASKPQKAEDSSKQSPRKLGVVRVA